MGVIGVGGGDEIHVCMNFTCKIDILLRRSISKIYKGPRPCSSVSRQLLQYISYFP